jgi:2,3-bisphosphoglycerate-dependent phosphoglycerate mutase
MQPPVLRVSMSTTTRSRGRPTVGPRQDRRSRRPWWLPSLLLLAGCLSSVATPRAGAAQLEPLVVYAVRHVERAEDGTSDPPISAAGEARARLLARMLTDAGITGIHTTDYRRTRSTVGPLAAAEDVGVGVYDPRDLPGLAEKLRAAGGRHVVVGHSNTTAELVEALGGDGHGPIEEMEYDRLYVVTLAPGGATTVLLRFGEPFVP